MAGVASQHGSGGDLRSPLFAWVWQRTACRVVSPARRSELLEGLSGRGLEVGIGTGISLSFYPPQVEALDAIEPEPALRALARRAAASAAIPVQVSAGSAEATGRPDRAYDFAVSSLVLCSVHSQDEALTELRRVLRPGGELRFYEHVAAESRPTQAAQRALDRTGVWPMLAGGCHLARNTVEVIARSGFDVTHLDRFTSGPQSVGVPFLLGRAIRR